VQKIINDRSSISSSDSSSTPVQTKTVQQVQLDVKSKLKTVSFTPNIKQKLPESYPKEERGKH